MGEVRGSGGVAKNEALKPGNLNQCINSMVACARLFTSSLLVTPRQATSYPPKKNHLLRISHTA